MIMYGVAINCKSDRGLLMVLCTLFMMIIMASLPGHTHIDKKV